MQRAYHQWFSPQLGKNMELLVFGHAGARVIFFPTRAAHFYDYENWRVIDAMSDKINIGQLQVYCVDSIDHESLYNQGTHPSGRILRHLQYEQYIIQEVVPLSLQLNPFSKLCAAGCSLGAYHALNITFKYPFLFNKAVGMSGRYNLQVQQGVFPDLFEGYHDENIYFNMPNQYVANLHDENFIQQLKKLEIILVIGLEDAFFEDASYLSNLLWSKQIANTLHIWHEEAHKPYYWRKMVQIYL
jgi:esterase/lipase superfamily enzyme